MVQLNPNETLSLMVFLWKSMLIKLKQMIVFSFAAWTAAHIGVPDLVLIYVFHLPNTSSNTNWHMVYRVFSFSFICNQRWSVLKSFEVFDVGNNVGYKWHLTANYFWGHICAHIRWLPTASHCKSAPMQCQQ